jgi:hypothetical protein
LTGESRMISGSRSAKASNFYLSEKAAWKVVIEAHGSVLIAKWNPACSEGRRGKRLEVSARINIIHINTQLRVAWRRSLEDTLKRQPNGNVAYKIPPPVVDSGKQIVASRLRLFNLLCTGEDNRT